MAGKGFSRMYSSVLLEGVPAFRARVYPAIGRRRAQSPALLLGTSAAEITSELARAHGDGRRLFAGELVAQTLHRIVRGDYLLKLLLSTISRSGRGQSRVHSFAIRSDRAVLTAFALREDREWLSFPLIADLRLIHPRCSGGSHGRRFLGSRFAKPDQFILQFTSKLSSVARNRKTGTI